MQMEIGAVIVAAGMSHRMGDFKPMMQVGSISVIHRLIHTLSQAGVRPIVVVTGHRADELEHHVSKLGVICVRNEDYATTQMFDSAKIGLSYIADKCKRCFFMPVDVPLFTVNTLVKLMSTRGAAVVPVTDGREGHPVLLSCKELKKILNYRGEGGLFGAMEACLGKKTLVDVNDPGILHDVDTAEDFSELLRFHNEQMFRPVVSARLCREEIFFGPGTAQLLTLLKDTGSVLLACKEMNLSYSKAWKMINTAEKELGFPVVKRQQGGRKGGGTKLTRQGEDLLGRYIEFEKESKVAVQKLFETYFEGFVR
jgi:molybdenum cofactor cytidylyltransferase